MISKCISIIKEKSTLPKNYEYARNNLRNDEDHEIVNRMVSILKEMIYSSEIKGAADVQAHNSMLKGELLTKLMVKDEATNNKSNIELDLFSNTTVWEFKKIISKKLGLAPRYLSLFKGSTYDHKEIDDM